MFLQRPDQFANAQVSAARLFTRRHIPSPDPSGLIAGTRVETETGWQAVETLHPGMRVHTLDGGLRPLVRVDRASLPAGSARVFRVPGGAFGACADLMMLAGQHLLMQTGDPRPECARALVPAAALDGIQGCAPIQSTHPVDIVTLTFADEEVIYANTGVRVVCPGDKAADWLPRLDGDTARVMLRTARLAA
ncbi:MAG: Hint domain-containing protein [Gemmobacter sp.]|nr:Hint domain-containing protein [Gemmobacter sp.]